MARKESPAAVAVSPAAIEAPSSFVVPTVEPARLATVASPSVAAKFEVAASSELVSFEPTPEASAPIDPASAIVPVHKVIPLSRVPLTKKAPSQSTSSQHTPLFKLASPAQLARRPAQTPTETEKVKKLKVNAQAAKKKENAELKREEAQRKKKEAMLARQMAREVMSTRAKSIWESHFNSYHQLYKNEILPIIDNELKTCRILAEI